MVEMTDAIASVNAPNGTAAKENASAAEMAASAAAADPKLKDLLALDVEYRQIEDEYQVKISEIQNQYEKLQAPLLEKRKEILNDEEKGLPGFWLQVLESHPIFADEIMEWDKEALELCI